MGVGDTAGSNRAIDQHCGVAIPIRSCFRNRDVL